MLGITEEIAYCFLQTWHAPLEGITETLHVILNCLVIQGTLNGGGGFKRGGFPIWTCPSFFVQFFGTFPIFLGFSRFARGWSGDFPDLSFSSFLAY